MKGIDELTYENREGIRAFLRSLPTEKLMRIVGQHFHNAVGSGYVNSQRRCILGVLFQEQGVAVPWAAQVMRWMHLPTDEKILSQEERLILRGIDAILRLNDRGELTTPVAIAALLGIAADDDDEEEVDYEP